jgi:signal transduction histidine kinase
MSDAHTAAVAWVVSPDVPTTQNDVGPWLAQALPNVMFSFVDVRGEPCATKGLPSLVIVDGRGEESCLCPTVAKLRVHSAAPLIVLLRAGSECGEEALRCGADELCEPTPTALAGAVSRAKARREAAQTLRTSLSQEHDRARQARLKRHNELLRVLARQLSTSEQGAQMQTICEAAANAMEVSRSGVWLFGKDRASIVAQDLYDVATGHHEAGHELTAEEFPAYFSALEEERVIAANDARTHPATRCFAKGYLEEYDVRSLLDAPIRAGSHVLGVLCHEQVGTARVWTDEDQNMAASLADLVAIAIEAREHRLAQEALRKSNQELEAARRIEAVGRLASGVAHDFNNVITVVSSYAFLLAKKLGKNDPLQGPVAEIGKAAERAADITRKLLALSRREPVEPRLFDVNATMRGMETFLRRLIGEHIELVLDLSPEPVVMNTDPGQLEQVVLNLVVNARDATAPEGGRITVSTTSELASDGTPECVIEVTDTGIGIAPDVQQHIFEPFYTTKGAGTGSGLGLFTVWGAVNQMNGKIEVESQLAAGSRFRLRFRAEAAETARRAVAPSRKPLMGKERVLLVEDEPQVREVTALILRDFGYRVLVAGDIDAAMEHARKEPAIDLLVSDIVMPRASGPVVAARLTELIPALKVLFVSGYNKEMLSGYDASLGPTLPKPFTAEQLGKKVREVLDGAAPKPSNEARLDERVSVGE